MSVHRRGHYTDDTQMSLALAEALYSGSPFTRDTVAQAFYTAYHRDKRPGYSSRTKAALEQSTVADFIKHSPRSVTVGAAMRAVPLGVVPDVETVVKYACLNAELTPGDRRPSPQRPP